MRSGGELERFDYTERPTGSLKYVRSASKFDGNVEKTSIPNQLTRDNEFASALDHGVGGSKA
jgi:hypothetical protein